MPSLFERIYANSPVLLQHVGLSAYGLMWKHRRYGGRFRESVQKFQIRENFSSEDWERYQDRELRQLLIHAGNHIPYYQNMFKDTKLTHQDLNQFSLNDLEKLPMLEKETMRRNPDDFIALTANPRKLHKYLTSGTTGTPLAILSSTETDRLVNAAYEARIRRWAGLNYKMSRAMVGGRLVVPQAHAQPPFWRYNLFEHQLYMSAFHISPANVPYYVSALNRFKPDYLVGYASSHFFLARMIAELGLNVYQPKAVLTSSEKLTQEMRIVIEKVYRCPVFDGYSAVENCCLVSECKHHCLHISPDVGIIELVNEEGNPASPGDPGEIVATGLLNYDQPLIRFRTGDLATLSSKPCPCGRQMPILDELIGRLEDTVIGPDGREMVRFHGIFIGLLHVREAQVIQNTLKNFAVRLVVEPDFNGETRQLIYQRFKDRLGPIELEYEFVDQIERTERGKFRSVISYVQRKQ